MALSSVGRIGPIWPAFGFSDAPPSAMKMAAARHIEVSAGHRIVERATRRQVAGIPDEQVGPLRGAVIDVCLSRRWSPPRGYVSGSMAARRRETFKPLIRVSFA
jgi:hypothetical protein